MDVWSLSYDYLQLLIYGWPFSLYLTIGSVLELLVLKNAAECTSQRLKWTSGARVMIIFDRCSFLDVLPETMKMFNYPVSEFQFSGIIWGVRISNSELAEELFGRFEFRITDSRQIYLSALRISNQFWKELRPNIFIVSGSTCVHQGPAATAQGTCDNLKFRKET